MPKVVGESVDRLVTVTMEPKRITNASGAPAQRGYVHPLYAAARRKQEDPLTYRAAKLLLDRVGTGDTLLIVTGAGGPPVRPVGEVDGYLGAAAIARAMMFGRKARVVFVSDEWAWGPLAATCRGADMILLRPEERYATTPAVFETMPRDHEDCEKRATELLDKYEPKAILAIERLGPNRKEVTHNFTGISRDPTQGKTQYLFDGAAARSIATIGIGDGGNEIGFGLIEDEVRGILPDATRCQCPCEGGTVCRVATDVLVVAAISDWGGYGVAANLAFQLEKPKVLVNADTLERMLRNCVEAGALDGQSNLPELSDDGIPLLAHRACVDMLTTLVTLALSEVDDPAH